MNSKGEERGNHTIHKESNILEFREAIFIKSQAQCSLPILSD